MGRSLAVVVAAALAITACGPSAGDDRPAAAGQDASLPPLGSIVQLGDSVASGEGTLYGYRYDPSGQDWIDGNIDARWPPPYPDCHVSPDAYANAVARYFEAELAQFACTGSTFANGIAAARTSWWTDYRPAQFGDWAAKTQLNVEYDDAAPQLVLVTLGADDMQFVAIVEHCVKNGYGHYFHIETLECTESNPGSTIQTDFFDFLPTLAQNYRTLVQWIKERATADGDPAPKIVFTNYPNPFPPNGEICNDTSYFYADQIRYLSSLVDDMNETIEETIEDLDDPDVAVVDASGAYTSRGVSHVWCTDDPWVYGLSIYTMWEPSEYWSQAPFHPTPEGQESIAEHVIPTVRRWFGPGVPPSSTTTTDAPATTGG